MPIAWGAMPETTTGAKSRLVHAGAMPMYWGAAPQRGRGPMAIEAGIAHIGCIPSFSSPAFDFFLVWPYKNKVFSFFSFFSSFWAYRPAAVLQLERAGGLAQNEEKRKKRKKPYFCKAKRGKIQRQGRKKAKLQALPTLDAFPVFPPLHLIFSSFGLTKIRFFPFFPFFPRFGLTGRPPCCNLSGLAG